MITKLTASKPAPRLAGRSKAKASNMVLRLYVAGHTPKSVAALANLRKICDEHLVGGHTLKVIDLLKDPKLARGDQILAIPTLVRRLPLPVRRILGDLSSVERVLTGLGLVPQK